MAAMFRATRLSWPPAASSQCPLETREGQERAPGDGSGASSQRGRDCSHTWEQIPPLMGKHRAQLQAAGAGGEGRGNGKSRESSAQFES